MNDDCPQQQPIFIVGLPRSGTTLMGSLLSAHPAVAIAPETHLLNYWMRQFRYLDLRHRLDFELFWEAFSTSQRFSYFGIDAKEAKAAILTTGSHDYRTIFTVILQKYAAQVNKQRWGEKTPAHYQYVDTLLGWYPNARIIHMLRDPRAVTASLLSVPWAVQYTSTHARRWRYGTQNLKRWLDEARVLVVKYETLVTETETELARVCQFIGETYTVQMFERSEATSPIINREGWAKVHLKAAMQPISTANIDKWRSKLSPTQTAIIEYVTRKEMLEHGYQPLTASLTAKQFYQLGQETAAYTVKRVARRGVSTGSWTELKAKIKQSPYLYGISKAVKQSFQMVSDASRVFIGRRHARSLASWRDYFSGQPIAGYIGWLGYDNLGDEAMYAAFREMFPQFQMILANDVHPIELILYHSLIKRQKLYEFIFLGGGTLINARKYLDALQSKGLRDQPCIVFGTGVLDPDFWARHRPQVDYAQEMAQWIAVLERAAFVGVRGPQSAKILASYGFPNARIIGDPALSLCQPKRPETLSNRIVALNLGCSGPLWGSQQILNEVVGRLAQYLLDEGWQVEFWPMHPGDLRLGRQLIRDYHLKDVSLWTEFRNIGRTMKRIHDYDLVIGQRLHAAVLACGSGVPAISLAYRPKCYDFMESIGMDPFAIKTDGVDLDKIVTLIEQIKADYVDHCCRLNAACDGFRLRQRQAGTEVLDILSLNVNKAHPPLNPSQPWPEKYGERSV